MPMFSIQIYLVTISKCFTELSACHDSSSFSNSVFDVFSTHSVSSVITALRYVKALTCSSLTPFSVLLHSSFPSTMTLVLSTFIPRPIHIPLRHFLTDWPSLVIPPLLLLAVLHYIVCISQVGYATSTNSDSSITDF